MNRVVFGIDYGSKLSGNTVLCIFDHARIHFMSVDKGVDADAFLYKAAEHFKPERLAIDAPLSLPGVYFGLEGCSNYHFREADLELNAMSPMFLGGLTARAMQLSERFRALGIDVFETYPRALSRQFELAEIGYQASKLGLSACKLKIRALLNPAISIDLSEIVDWHHFDALLALMSCLNCVAGTQKVYGRPDEGQIFV